jgi:UTP-glucose-1-phosphate uridylyltransferase
MIDTYIFAGGRGTRIAPVLSTVPKFLAPIGATTVGDLILDQLEAFGARRVVLGLGYGAACVIKHVALRPRVEMEIVPIVELRPLGTTGALRLAAPLLRSDPVLVMNGDTLVDVDLKNALETYQRLHGPQKMLSVHKCVADATNIPKFSGMAFLNQLALVPMMTWPDRLSEGWPYFCRGFIDVGTPEGLAAARRARGVPEPAANDQSAPAGAGGAEERKEERGV